MEIPPPSRPAPIAPPGGVALGVEHVTWRHSTTLQVALTVASAADGLPASLVYTSFTLETDLGAIVDASSSSIETCPPGVSVAPGASLGCTVFFDLPAGHSPVRAHYAADVERTASASIVACSPGGAAGLCPASEVCVGGACQPVCSFEVPDGFCPGAAERCSRGECVAPCSPSESAGWCDDGACVDGSCTAGCFVFGFENEDCFSCVSATAITVCGPIPGDTCYDSGACTDCMLYGDVSSCECAASEACEGCELAAQDFSECLAAVCPVCIAP